MVYERGTGAQDSHPVFRLADLWRFFGLDCCRNNKKHGRCERAWCLALAVHHRGRHHGKHFSQRGNPKAAADSSQIVIAFAAYFIMPNFPRTTTWLSEQEKQLAIWRLEEDIGEDDWVNSEEQTFFHGAKLAVKDPKAWLLLATIYGFTSTGTVTTLFPSVVKGLGYGDVATLLLTVPPYVSPTP